MPVQTPGQVTFQTLGQVKGFELHIPASQVSSMDSEAIQDAPLVSQEVASRDFIGFLPGLAKGRSLRVQ